MSPKDSFTLSFQQMGTFFVYHPESCGSGLDRNTSDPQKIFRFHEDLQVPRRSSVPYKANLVLWS